MKNFRRQTRAYIAGRYTVWSLTISVFLVCMLLAGCAELPDLSVGGVDVGDVFEVGKAVKDIAKSFQDITPEEEYYLGRAVGATIVAQYKPYNNQEANYYLNLLGQILAQASDMPETFGGYHFLILDSDEINAFAAPGGLIFVTRGLLRCAKHEDALAAVLAHEIGHVQHKHGLQSIKKSRLSSALTTIAIKGIEAKTEGSLATLTGIFQDSITDITTTMVNNGYSRSFEREADKASVTILQRVGYDPNGLIDILRIMEERLDPEGKDFAKTHPSPASRIADIQEFIGDYVEVKTPEARQSRFEVALGSI